MPPKRDSKRRRSSAVFMSEATTRDFSTFASTLPSKLIFNNLRESRYPEGYTEKLLGEINQWREVIKKAEESEEIPAVSNELRGDEEYLSEYAKYLKYLKAGKAVVQAMAVKDKIEERQFWETVGDYRRRIAIQDEVIEDVLKGKTIN